MMRAPRSRAVSRTSAHSRICIQLIPHDVVGSKLHTSALHAIVLTMGNLLLQPLLPTMFS
eukprot:671778-Prorocentrum_lima.AAC.1